MKKQLKDYANSVTSQFGEDGILTRMLEILSIKHGECVEFGAWDGKTYSNTYNLIKNCGWEGALIEGCSARFKELENTYSERKDLALINRYVGLKENNNLDSILSSTGISREFDLLSIDIDGNDYHVWHDLTHYRPKIVVIEFNPTIPNGIFFVQDRDPAVNQGNSLLALQRLGSKKNYELVCCTDINAVFVQEALFPLFGIENNSLESLHKDAQYETQLYQLYDGTIKISGCKQLLWHGVEIKEEELQILPEAQRVYPGS